MLATGNYGAITIGGTDKASKTYITAASGAIPVFTQLIINSDQWEVSGVEVRPTTAVDAVLINGDNVTFKNNTVSYGNRTGWTAANWLSRVADGITFYGINARITGNKVITTRYAIQGVETATNGVVENNIVDGFTGDGLRGLANNMIFSGNLVKNAISVDATHQDGFQSWSLSNGTVGTGVVKGNIIKGNTFINAETPGQPLEGAMQGIGLFDGMYEDWVIEDNVVIVNHWHGISVYGARNVTIRNNTVIDPNQTTPGPAWIQIVNHKNGTAPVNSRIEKNLANTIKTNVGVTVTDNKTINLADYSNNFTNWESEDLSLKSTSSVVGYGARIGTVTSPTPAPTPTPTPITTPTPTPIVTTFKIGDRVSMTKNVNVRTSGLISATTLIGTNPLGSIGTLIAGPTQSTDGMIWFNINFDAGFDGWVGTDNYILVAPTPVPNVTTTATLNVRSTAGGTILGTQPQGATGVSDSTTQVTINGTTWIYVNFTTGLDGYVSTTYLTGSGVTTNNQALISSLLAQLVVLQAALAALMLQ